MYFALKPNNFGWFIGSCSFTGFFAVASLPVTLETGCELTYPVAGTYLPTIFFILFFKLIPYF